MFSSESLLYCVLCDTKYYANDIGTPDSIPPPNTSEHLTATEVHSTVQA